jgi:hypothetical protein
MEQTVERIMIKRNDVPESDWASIYFNQDFDLTGIDENDLQSEKHDEQKFQHFIESQLIQVTKMKMQMIQCNPARWIASYYSRCEKNIMKTILHCLQWSRNALVTCKSQCFLYMITAAQYTFFVI